MEEVLENALEFLESGEDNLKKSRFNASVSDFFKAIVTFADYLIYKEIKRIPKNHSERFELLENNFEDLNRKIRDYFQKYRDSYNLRLKKEDALALKNLAYETKNLASDKEETKNNSKK